MTKSFHESRPTHHNRRHALAAGVATTSLAALGPPVLAQQQQRQADDKRNRICAFIKFVQDLPYDELAERIAEMGFDGIEATVRNGGHVLPERVEDDLPKLVEALEKHGLEISVMASNVNSVKQPLTEKVLRTAARLGVRTYRMGYYRYDAKRPVAKQIDELRPVVRDLAQMNRELKLRAVYQNHAGASSVGAPIWDIYELLRRHSVKEIGVAFDIRHATVEGGLAWPLHFNVVQPVLGAVYVKDFVWNESARPVNVPLGEGRVDRRFFKLLGESKYSGLISLHVEYLPKAGLAKNLQALRDDLATLRKLLKA